jgi:hypothetical protein
MDRISGGCPWQTTYRMQRAVDRLFDDDLLKADSAAQGAQL